MFKTLKNKTQSVAPEAYP